MQKLKHLLGIGDSKFYRTMLAICLPIMLQQGLSSALYMIDNIMVGQLGETAISAVGVANQLTFLLQIFGMGISGGAGVFARPVLGTQGYRRHPPGAGHRSRALPGGGGPVHLRRPLLRHSQSPPSSATTRRLSIWP